MVIRNPSPNVKKKKKGGGEDIVELHQYAATALCTMV